MCSYSFTWFLCKWDLSNIQGTRHTKRNLVNAQESPNNKVSQETLEPPPGIRKDHISKFNHFQCIKEILLVTFFSYMTCMYQGFHGDNVQNVLICLLLFCLYSQQLFLSKLLRMERTSRGLLQKNILGICQINSRLFRVGFEADWVEELRHGLVQFPGKNFIW